MTGSKPQSADSIFMPGQTAHESGVYHAVHHPEHRPAHSLLLRRGDRFPGCRRCESPVYLLIHAAPYLGEDADFAPEPSRKHKSQAV